MTTRTPSPLVRATLIALAAGALLTGCRGDRSGKRPHQFFPDLDDAPKWKPQTGSEFFADGRTMRPTVEGTVPFGRVDFVSDESWAADFMEQRADLIKADEGFYFGTSGVRDDGTPNYIERIPLTVDRELILRGEERFGIYCAVCHGYSGDGKGMVGVRWTGVVPSFHDPKYVDPNEPDGKGRDGFFFYTARHGVPGPDGFAMPGDPPEIRFDKIKKLKMPSYAHALNERDTWAVVAYIRVLQESHSGSLADIPADQRPTLDRERERLIAEARRLAEEAAAAEAAKQPAPPAGGAK